MALAQPVHCAAQRAPTASVLSTQVLPRLPPQRPACRLTEAEDMEQARGAEAAVLQLLDATDPARRKRAADGSWRPATGTSSGAGEAPGQAILRLNGLYSSSSPPPVSLIRHPQVTKLTYLFQMLQANIATPCGHSALHRCLSTSQKASGVVFIDVTPPHGQVSCKVQIAGTEQETPFSRQKENGHLIV